MRIAGGECAKSLGIMIEEEGLEGRPYGIVVAAREQLLLAAELESHRASDDAARASHYLGELHSLNLCGERDGTSKGLRDIGEQ